jgi:hypothetical protein
MCEHKWVPYKIEAEPSVCVNQGWISTAHPSAFITTQIKCAECGEVRNVSESPLVKAQQEIDAYAKAHRGQNG